jgi:hypothetical protein
MALNPHSVGVGDEIFRDERFARIFNSPEFHYIIQEHNYPLNLFTEGAPVFANTLISASGCILGITECGKTNALAVILEETGRYKVSYSVIDSEGDICTICELAELEIEKYEVVRDHTDKEVYDMVVRNIIERRRVVYTFGASMTLEQRRFFVLLYASAMLEFKDRLFKKGKAVPHLLVIDEAHLFMPLISNKNQKYVYDLKLKLGIIASTGRKDGICLFIASTRAASLDTNILSQMKNRFLMKATEPVDVERYKATISNISNMDMLWENIKTVPTFQVGEAFFLPRSNRICRVLFRIRDSRHISKTPTIGDYEKLDGMRVEDWKR